MKTQMERSIRKSMKGSAMLLLGAMLFVSCSNDKSRSANLPESNNEKVYTQVEKMPKFKGDLTHYLGDSINYPATERMNNITGIVYLSFVIGSDGSVRQAKVLKSSNNANLDAEALRVVSGMPEWQPGEQDGKPVAVQFNLPIHFELK